MSDAEELVGTVERGRGLGVGRMSDPSVPALLRRLSGLDVVPGTLNLRLPAPLARGPHWRHVAAVDLDPGWAAATGQAGYHLAPITVAGRFAGLALQADEPGEPGYPPDLVELVSDVRLRAVLGLADGDSLAVVLRSR